jgi:hypothetical protein
MDIRHTPIVDGGQARRCVAHSLGVRALPTGTVTFFVSDIEGSTRLLRELGREGLGEADYAEAWAIGRATDPEQLLELITDAGRY